MVQASSRLVLVSVQTSPLLNTIAITNGMAIIIRTAMTLQAWCGLKFLRSWSTQILAPHSAQELERGFVRKWEDFRRLLSHIEIVPPRALNDFKGCGLQQPPDTGQIFALVDLWVVSSRICGQKGFPHLPRNPHGLVGEIVSCTWRHRSTSPSTPSGPPSQG